ncbi:MAG: hypothetical protein ABJB69_08490 [Spartobacteria bacterium]
MASPDAVDFKLTVLSPGGRDGAQYFEQPSDPDSPAHAPVNFHALAACTGGSFHRDLKSALAEKAPILLLLRGNFKATQRALAELKEAKRTVVVSLKETGLHQIAQQLADRGRLARFIDVVAQADGCIATTPEAAEIFRMARAKQDAATVVFIPTPYPLEDRQWNMSVPPDQQAGIFVGTREWNVPSRNHAAALLLARQLSETTGESVTVFNFDRGKGRRLLAELKFPPGKLRVIEEQKSYADYLREIAKHKIVLQLDRSRVPGQVAGDALLGRTICVGGDGSIERIAFPGFCSEGRTFDQLGKIASELATNTNARATAIVESQWRAMERLSFSATRKQLETFYSRIAAK